MIITFFLFNCASTVVQESKVAVELPKADYEIQLNLRDISDDTFKVTYLFAADADKHQYFTFQPGGAFESVDLSNFLQNFRAFDANGRISPSRRIAVNRWQLMRPWEVVKIQYDVNDTWDLPISQGVAEMLGTAISENFAFINGRGVFGILSGMENATLNLKLELPENWLAASELQQIDDANFFAENFRMLTLMPLLAGYLSEASDRISGGDVFLYTYSKTDIVVADDLLRDLRIIIEEMDEFVEGRVPFDNYTMLFIFDETFAGGVQYQNNAVFVFDEQPLDKIRKNVRDVMAHEFFHRVIPFSIRSDAINTENMIRVKPSQHLWFYEGVTEWASDIVQLRAEVKTLEDFLFQDIRQKMFQAETYHPNVSLRDLSLQSRGNPDQYANVYSRGALVALLLDIHLLELSNGSRGLREVINDLLIDYGPEKPLPEDKFFDILLDYCGPEFAPFFQKYIIRNQPLPYESIFKSVGLRYIAKEIAQPEVVDFGWWATRIGNEIQINWMDDDLQRSGLKRNDRILAINGKRISIRNYQEQLEKEFLAKMDIGESYQLQIERNGKPQTLTLQTMPFKNRHLFSGFPRITPLQGEIRNAWVGR